MRTPRTRRQFAAYFKFAFVRNPWSRVYSWYANVMGDEIQLHNHGLDQPISFERFPREHAHCWG